MDPFLVTGQLVTMAVQTAGPITTAQTAVGVYAGRALAGQAVDGAIAALQATLAEHAHATVFNMEAAQTFLRQQLAIHARGQRFRMHAAPVVTTITAIPAIMPIAAVRPWMDGLFVVVTRVFDNHTQHSQPGKGSKGLAQVVVSGMGRGGAETGEGDGSRGHGSDELAVNWIGHKAVLCGFGKSKGQSGLALIQTWARPRQTGNIGQVLSDIMEQKALMLLNVRVIRTTLGFMKQIALTFALTFALTGAATAQCFADYKAKQDNPLRLHYGVAQLNGQCARGAAQGELQGRLAARGWTLLQVMSVFGPEGLDQRKDSAGQYYLRF